MSYTLDTSRTASAFTSGRRGGAITTIVVHHWGDPAGNPTFDGTVGYFARGGSNTSAHYVVEAGRVARMVADSDTAYHAGSWPMNLRSIALECNPRCSDADKETVGELIRDLRAAHGSLRIIGHQDVIPTACPGRYYPPATVLAPWLVSPQEDDMNATQANQLAQIYNAVFLGGSSLEDDGRSISKSLANIAAAQKIPITSAGVGAVDVDALAKAIVVLLPPINPTAEDIAKAVRAALIKEA